MRHIIITDHNTKKLFGAKVKKRFKNSKIISVPPGESSKSREQKAKIEDEMFKLGCDRGTKIIALGGGVVGDLAGFVAATYMRGISYIQVPTTLLAMVDSSIGGKTAINTQYGKNLIGAFWQPEKTITDVTYLKTLPKKHVMNGLVEAVKMFITSDKRSFKFVEKNFDKILEKDPEILKEVIRRAMKIKKRIVETDEKEKGVRAILNFGHTVGHAMELLSDYKMAHGRAVALGILVEARAAGIPEKDFKRIRGLIERMGYKTAKIETFERKKLIEAMRADKKSNDKRIRYVELKKIGKVSKKLQKLKLTKLKLNGW